MGKLKERVYPEDIVLNLSEDAVVPPVPDIGDGKKHKWGGVEHKNTVTWLCKWKDSINGEDKCVWLSANSSWKGALPPAPTSAARAFNAPPPTYPHSQPTAYGAHPPPASVHASDRSPPPHPRYVGHGQV